MKCCAKSIISVFLVQVTAGCSNLGPRIEQVFGIPPTETTTYERDEMSNINAEERKKELIELYGLAPDSSWRDVISHEMGLVIRFYSKD